MGKLCANQRWKKDTCAHVRKCHGQVEDNRRVEEFKLWLRLVTPCYSCTPIACNLYSSGFQVPEAVDQQIILFSARMNKMRRRRLEFRLAWLTVIGGIWKNGCFNGLFSVFSLLGITMDHWSWPRSSPNPMISGGSRSVSCHCNSNRPVASRAIWMVLKISPWMCIHTLHS